MKNRTQISLTACTLAAVLLVGAGQSLAATRTWTGGGDGTTLSQATNWENSTAPSSGERISIPAGKTVRVTAAADANLLVSLAGADLGGTLEIANYAATVTLPSTFTLAGSGAFRVLSVNKIEIKGDNSDFTGSFFTSNTNFKVQHNRALGIACPVTHCVTAGSTTKMEIEADGIYNNPVTLRQTGTGTTYFSYKSTANVTNYGNFALYAYSNNSCNRFEGDAGKILAFFGDVVLYKGYLDCTGNVHFNGTGLTDTGTDSGYIMCDSGSLTIGRTLDPATVRYVRATGSGKVTFSSANALNGCKVHLHSTSPQLDLNGIDQTMGDLEDTSPLGGATIKSASSATLTMTGAAVNNRYGGCFSGAVSFTFDSDGNTITLTNNPAKPSTTTGSLTARAGTIALGKEAVFSALDSLVLDGGELSVAAGATVNSSVRLRVTSNGGTLTLADKAELGVQTARVNGGFAEAGVYTAANPGPFDGIISGEGTLRVASDMEPIDDSPVYTWIGGNGTSLSTGANWQGGVAPTFGGTETLVFNEDNGTANVSGVIKAYALKFDCAGTFALTGEGTIDVAYDGVTVTNSSSASTVEVTVEPSLRVLTDQTWVVPAGDTLTLSSELKAAPSLGTMNVVTGRGSGQLHLLADNSAFLPQFDFKDRFSVRTTNGKGLGSASRTVSCSVMPLFYGGKALTNEVPFLVRDTTYQNDYDKINDTGTPLVQKGLITFYTPSAKTCYIQFRDDGELLGGLAESKDSGNSLWLRAMDSGKTVKMSGAPFTANFNSVIIDQVGDFVLGAMSGESGYKAFRISRTGLTCEAEDALRQNAKVNFGQPNNGAGNRGSGFPNSYGVLDLGGFSQRVAGMGITGLISAAAGYAYVTSCAPASVVSVGVQTNENVVARFLGAAGFTLDAAGAVMAFSNAVSATSGDLRVSNGLLRLDRGYVWGGSNTVTVAGGTLKVTAGAADGAFGGNATLTKMYLSGGGVLDLPAGSTVTVRKLCVDGVEAPAGTYCGADGSADKRYAAHFGSGSGVLHVRRSEVAGMKIIFR